MKKGVRLSDLIQDAGFKNSQEIQHVQFEGAEGYGASIPLKKGFNDSFFNSFTNSLPNSLNLGLKVIVTIIVIISLILFDKGIKPF